MTEISTLKLVCPAGHRLKAAWSDNGRWPEELVVEPCEKCGKEAASEEERHL